ncbi:hypothetical protein K505DRAFT_370891 [Melanomma pulvis-pyrius CBS 109.77]|uniref:F-box domain-containing protein n=1 Tax=Melanomma pulvis-pyrius CBS 109.77 TaxID=1314802 RepID=A0A6A6XSY0_9PLEO|nr:hypothetical protein K505DRAFT_370891 [Melanomma pulvis-pyrius CBS 109.77]
MANLDQTPPILALPLELRELIYKEVLSNPSQGPQLLQSCHEIYAEGNKFLFQRPILFRGQIALYHWLDQVPETHLHHVTEITLELQNVDMRPLLSPIASTASTSSTSKLLTWELHELELDRLDQALRRLQNIKTFTIRALPERQSFLYREFLAKVLESLGSLYPNLSSLSLQGNLHHQSLSFLSSLQELSSLSFDGFSSSSPVETASILSNLTHLTNLSLVCQHTLLTPTTHMHSSFTSKRQSLTTPVFLAMRQLASLSLNETMHPATTTSLFFTPEVLTPLRDHTSLNSLSIRLSHAPNTETLEAFEDFLEHALAIHRLELDWPGLEPEVLETYALLSETVRDVWMRCEGLEMAFDVLYLIMESREAGGLKGLERVVLMRGAWSEVVGGIVGGTEDEDDDVNEEHEGVEDKDEGDEGSEGDTDLDDDSTLGETDEINVARVKRSLNALGVQVSWCTESA